MATPFILAAAASMAAAKCSCNASLLLEYHILFSCTSEPTTEATEANEADVAKADEDHDVTGATEANKAEAFEAIEANDVAD